MCWLPFAAVTKEHKLGGRPPQEGTVFCVQSRGAEGKGASRCVPSRSLEQRTRILAFSSLQRPPAPFGLGPLPLSSKPAPAGRLLPTAHPADLSASLPHT